MRHAKRESESWEAHPSCGSPIRERRAWKFLCDASRLAWRGQRILSVLEGNRPKGVCLILNEPSAAVSEIILSMAPLCSRGSLDRAGAERLVD